MQNTKENSKNK